MELSCATIAWCTRSGRGAPTIPNGATGAYVGQDLNPKVREKIYGQSLSLSSLAALALNYNFPKACVPCAFLGSKLSCHEMTPFVPVRAGCTRMVHLELVRS
jgi:hypothetical protein